MREIPKSSGNDLQSCGQMTIQNKWAESERMEGARTECQPSLLSGDESGNQGIKEDEVSQKLKGSL